MSETLQFDIPPEVEACDMVVLYDRETGSIRHTHRCFTWRGGEHPSREELEREAREQARRARSELDGVEVLHVDPRKVDLDSLTRVDVKRRELVYAPVPTRAQRRQER